MFFKRLFKQFSCSRNFRSEAVFKLRALKPCAIILLLPSRIQGMTYGNEVLMKNAWKTLKLIVYFIAGCLIMAFSEQVMEYVVILVGAVMTVYAIETIIVSIFKKTVLHEDNELFEGLILILLAIVLLFTDKNNLEKVCVIWAIWSILRETEEIKECLHDNFHRNPPKFTKVFHYIHCVESAIVIVLSLAMLLSPTEKTAHTHVILLGLELILEVAFPLMNTIAEKICRRTEHKNTEKTAY